ncbi:hypothetical protein [Christiangramia portivictoriae]|uniref:hypothetical protein n=1 Tax=Christiangramia portivictoriae TaxID=326069 RepID=UPI000410D63E|nr:hypothetical protein [Christiangramia portivictoriae]
MKVFSGYFLLAIWLLSCSVSKPESQQDYQQELHEQLQKIEALVGESHCDDSEDCDYLALGAKPCGGPQAYVIFSNDIDRQPLQRLVEDYTNLEKEYNEKFGITSDCALVSPPQNIGCVNTTCTQTINE